MSKIAIVTDSTANLSKESIEEYQIHTLPLKIEWEGKTYLDGIDITSKEFYPLLEKCSDLPTTSQPTIDDFLTKFEELAADHDGIVVPLISSGLSGTCASAWAAMKRFDKIPVEVIDTKSTSGAQVLVVLAAARAASAGKNFAEVTQVAQTAVDNMHTFFVVDTLKYLHKGGRIGGASRYLGATLNIKPILYLNSEGKIDALEKVRTKKKAHKRLISLAHESADGNKVCVGLMHAAAPDEAEQVRQELEKQVTCSEVITVEISPAIGTHVGPGTIGIALYQI